ncbi:MAG: ABC transporter ATP-binding protein [Clostridiales bacterium]|nr:ABC transporter ATP-binding protein [Clostridiales bacterium]
MANDETRTRHGWKANAQLFKKFYPYFKPYGGILALDLFFAALTTLCDLALPLIVRYFTGSPGSLTVRAVLLLGGLYIVLRLVDASSNYYMQSIGHVMGTNIETDMRRDMFAHLQRLSNSFYDNAKIGQIMSRITTDLFEITEFAHHTPEEVFITSIKIVAAFGILLSINVPLTLIIFAIFPFMVYFSGKFSGKMRETFKQSRHQLGELNAQVEDSLSGIRVVKSFANEDLEKEKFSEGNNGFLRIKRHMYRNMAGFHSVTRLFDGLMFIVVVVLGALFLIAGSNRITAADYIAYILFTQTLLVSIRRLIEFSEQIMRGITGIERFVEIMEVPVEIDDAPDAVEIDGVRGDITFDHVSFSYEEGQENVLTDINLHVAAGDNIALVGPSGSGKSTLCSLIPRFYEVTSGRILLDGEDIRRYTLHSLRNHIGMVQQDVYLFSGTVVDNIRYGRPGASDEDIVLAAKRAGAHEFIMELEHGYNTYVGEHGTKLSGGQKQRISIARVFLKNPPVLILDEATSALDNESELIVQKSLEELMKGRTTFTIAHRLTTIRNAKVILVLTEEGIAEQGSHEELMAKKGVYHSLYKLYSEAK